MTDDKGLTPQGFFDQAGHRQKLDRKEAKRESREKTAANTSGQPSPLTISKQAELKRKW